MSINTEQNPELNVVIGPMYSGKSTELLRIYNRYKRNYKILVINHNTDIRYGENSVNTHNQNSVSSKSVSELYDSNITENIDNYNIILIDEGQFFKNLYKFCKDIVENKNKIVYVFGLSGDSNRQKFGEILDLIPIADNVTLLKSICNKCKIAKDAQFTLRITKNTEQVSVGGNNEYMAVCRNCWLESSKNII